MNTRTLCGEEVSPLGFGMMRLPLKDGMQGGSHSSAGTVDEQASIDLLRYAIDNGINYVDTAYSYIEGESERITGLALEGGYRDRVYLATKSPTWLYENENTFDEKLAEQLGRLRTDRIDFYLLHSLNAEKYRKTIQHGAIARLQAAKEAGTVRHIGFSFHDNLDLFKRIIDDADWDFCQIQLNYLDQNFQAGLEGMRYAKERGIDVIVMEPLRGGLLADPPDRMRIALASIEIDRMPTEWAFDYLWDMPEVGTILSGMGTLDQVRQNIEFMERSHPGMFEECARQGIADAKTAYESYDIVPCTGCNYCRSSCPQDIAIAYNLYAYNLNPLLEDFKKAKTYYDTDVPKFGARASECIQCGECESHCPQNIEIARLMPEVDDLLG